MEELGHEQSATNSRTTVTTELLGEVLLGNEDEHLFTTLSGFTIDAVLTDDIETLIVIEREAHRALSPSLGLSRSIQARMITYIEMASHAILRYTPPLSDAELTYLQLADGQPYKKERGSEFTPEERRLMQLGCMVNQVYWMRLTPRGEGVLTRSRPRVEREAARYRPHR